MRTNALDDERSRNEFGTLPCGNCRESKEAGQENSKAKQAVFSVGSFLRLCEERGAVRFCAPPVHGFTARQGALSKRGVSESMRAQPLGKGSHQIPSFSTAGGGGRNAMRLFSPALIWMSLLHLGGRPSGMLNRFAFGSGGIVAGAPQLPANVCHPVGKKKLRAFLL